MDYYQSFQEWFFQKEFWLAENVTWEDLQNKDDGIYIAQPADLWRAIPVAAVIFILRILFEK